MEQKQVTLIGLRAENNGIIRCAELTPDILEKRLVLFTGNVGNGKSTLLDMAKVAVTGTDAIKKKDILEKGYLAEAQLLDGDIKLFVGARVSEYQRGEKAGEPKFETFLYAKDANGKPYQPIIDGVAATPSDYVRMLTTDLTSSMPDLFSENPTTHRKLIERLFRPELQKLKIDETVERIESAKKQRDVARTMCQANGAFKERFEDEGYTEAVLEKLQRIDVGALDRQISDLQVQRGIRLNNSDSVWELVKNKIDTQRKDELQKIKDETARLKEELRKDNETKAEIYRQAQSKYEKTLEMRDILLGKCNMILEITAEIFKQDDMRKDTIIGLVSQRKEELLNAVINKPEIPEGNAKLRTRIAEMEEKYRTLEATPLQYPDRTTPDVSDLDAKITALTEQRESAEANNRIYDRYQLWLDWIEKKGIYEKEIDTLRKLYASVNTGVDGMKIVPRETESGRVEVFIMYNGCYDPAYFNNPDQEYRMMFEYSSFQRTIIGLMLQAARLNLKPKALRIAFVDDVAFTQKDVAVLQDIAERLDLKLITAWTHEVEKETLIEGQVMIQGGEVFFNKD